MSKKKSPPRCPWVGAKFHGFKHPEELHVFRRLMSANSALPQKQLEQSAPDKDLNGRISHPEPTTTTSARLLSLIDWGVIKRRREGKYFVYWVPFTTKAYMNHKYRNRKVPWNEPTY